MLYYKKQFEGICMLEKRIIYLAGPLFNTGDRVNNLLLEKQLIFLGYEVILPQREALKHFDGQKFDTAAIVQDCIDACSSTIFVGNLDGPDADSGTCVEYGIAIAKNTVVIVYRTNFRTAEEKEVGVNAMLKAKGTSFIYEPCYFTDLSEVEPYYKKLAKKIDEAIKKI